MADELQYQSSLSYQKSEVLPSCVLEILTQTKFTYEVIGFSLDTILARVLAKVYINDIMKEHLEFAKNYALMTVTSIVEKSLFPNHDSEEEFDFQDYQEPKPSLLDTNVSFSLNIKRTTLITKFEEAAFEVEAVSPTQTGIHRRGTLSIVSILKKFEQKGLKHLSETEGLEILPQHLDVKNEEEDRFIFFQRQKKEREAQNRKEEQLKLEELEKKLQEDDENNNKTSKQREDEMDRKQYTYGTFGEIMLIKPIQTDHLPSGILLPPYKIVKPKPKRASIVDVVNLQSEELGPTLNSSDDPSKKTTDGFKKKAISKRESLMSTLDLTKGKQQQDVIVPMGSVFDDIVAQVGTIIYEGGKSKRGMPVLSRMRQGNMSKEEYNNQKGFEQFNQESNKATQNYSEMKLASPVRNNSQVKKPQLVFNLLDEAQISKVLPLQNSLMQMTFYQSQNISKMNDSIPIEGSRSARHLDKITVKSQNSTMNLQEGYYSSQILNSNAQTSLIDSFKHPRKVSFGGLNSHGTQSDWKGLLSAKFGSLKESSSKVRLQPLTSRNTSESQEDECIRNMESLKQKNKLIMFDRDWGQNSQVKIPQKVSKKPILVKSSSQLMVNNKKKEREHFIQSIKNVHLPPPPLGKSIGHGLNIGGTHRDFANYRLANMNASSTRLDHL